MHDGKGADQRHRHRYKGYERSTPVAQEQHHHDNDKKNRLQQGGYHRLQRGTDKHRRVIRDARAESFRKVAFKPLHGCTHRLRNVECVSARTLDDLQRDGRFTVKQTAQCVGIGPHLNAGDIAQARHLAVAACTNDDVAELLLIS